MPIVKGICRVCGKEYEKSYKRAVKTLGYCSERCEKRAMMRKRYNLPINDVECEEVKRRRRKERDEEEKRQRALKRKPPDYTCKRDDCIYKSQGGDPTCDYLLKTGHRRGCPVDKCIKYERRNYE